MSPDTYAKRDTWALDYWWIVFPSWGYFEGRSPNLKTRIRLSSNRHVGSWSVAFAAELSGKVLLVAMVASISTTPCVAALNDSKLRLPIVASSSNTPIHQAQPFGCLTWITRSCSTHSRPRWRATEVNWSRSKKRSTAIIIVSRTLSTLCLMLKSPQPITKRSKRRFLMPMMSWFVRKPMPHRARRTSREHLRVEQHIEESRWLLSKCNAFGEATDHWFGVPKIDFR